MVTRIISGGQTGADRGGLDAAIDPPPHSLVGSAAHPGTAGVIDLGIDHGGWCPAGRRAEDGAIPIAYNLRETLAADYSVRTQLNVRDSDGTVVFTRGTPTGGSALTIDYATRTSRPVLHIDLVVVDLAAAASRIRGWCNDEAIQILNVAGSRDSEAPGIGAEAHNILVRALTK